MMQLIIIVYVIGAVPITQALKCITCYASESFEKCDVEGHLQQCNINQKSCETVVRRYREHLWITKGCKNTNACIDNQEQNFKESGKSTQCNSDQRSSVCSCCCGGSDLCNAGRPDCVKFYDAPKRVSDCPLTSTTFPHGKMECYNEDKVCRYECTEDEYIIWPAGRDTNVCLDNGTWAHEKPCCFRPCPPYYLYDDIKLLHFERENAERRLSNIFDVFVYGVVAEDAMLHAALYFNQEPVLSSVVKFNDYEANATRYMELVRERIKINNTGPVNMGAAIQYALDHLFTPQGGMRTDTVPKALGILTNANPDDDVQGPAEEARRRGIRLYIIGIELDGDFKFNMEKLLQITGDRNMIWIFDQDYGETFQPHHFDHVDQYYCPNPCKHVLHGHE